MLSSQICVYFGKKKKTVEKGLKNGSFELKFTFCEGGNQRMKMMNSARGTVHALPRARVLHARVRNQKWGAFCAPRDSIPILSQTPPQQP